VKQIAQQFTMRALAGAADLPPAQRAELYDFASHVLIIADCHEEAEAAKTTAHHLREAECSQMLLRALLTPSA